MQSSRKTILTTLAAGLIFASGPFVSAYAKGDIRLERGKASYYHPERFTGRPMANGERFDPRSNSAAHRTLPLGTLVRVTNLENGASRTVVIEDRGPHTKGRIIDLSPRTAEELGMRDQGVVLVELQPIGRSADSR